MLYYFLLCAFFQGFFKDISDALMSGRFQRKFNITQKYSFFGTESWVRKYKNNDSTQGDKFFLSSSLFVWLTDGWHLSNTFGMIANVISLILSFMIHVDLVWGIAYALAFWVIRSTTHHVLFTYYFREKSLTT